MIRIALAQLNPTVGDLDGNRQKMIRILEETRALGVECVVFPELAITGYPPEDLLFKRRFINENIRTVTSLLPYTRGLVCLVGFVHAEGEHLYNAAAILSQRRFCGVYYKNHLPNYGVFDEKRYFTPGRVCCILVEEALRIGVSICEDLWVEKGPPYIASRHGAKLLINISASPYEVGKQDQRRKLFSRRAKEAKAYLLYANLTGGQDELIFDGGSMIFDPHGKLLNAAPQFEETLLIQDLDIPSGPVSSLKIRKKALIQKVPLPRRSPMEKRALPKRKIAPLLSREEEIYQALVLGTRDYVRKNGFQDVVLGLSGGIDSSLVACIAVEALGKTHVTGVSMPSSYSSSETQQDARHLAHALGIRFVELPIEGIFREMLKLLQGIFQDPKEGVAEENLQARLRGVLLMALSNKFGWLVLTTGNKSEMSTGYCTLYGDMAGGFAVIKDVPKTWVYALAALRNQKGKVIPDSVIARAPTAELRPNQKDSDTLPPYEVLDPILASYIEKNLTLSQMRRSGLDPMLAQKIIQRVDGNEYKRRQGPPGIKITPRAFGKDWRFPITNRYRERWSAS